MGADFAYRSAWQRTTGTGVLAREVTPWPPSYIVWFENSFYELTNDVPSELQNYRRGSCAIRRLKTARTSQSSKVHASQCGMSELSLPQLYRHVLHAARKFPSIKRESLVQEIKAEFAANKVHGTSQDLLKLSALHVAIESNVSSS